MKEYIDLTIATIMVSTAILTLIHFLVISYKSRNKDIGVWFSFVNGLMTKWSIVAIMAIAGKKAVRNNILWEIPWSMTWMGLSYYFELEVTLSLLWVYIMVWVPTYALSYYCADMVERKERVKSLIQI